MPLWRQETLDESTTKLQQAADDIATWTHKWHIELNETKSTYINFTNQKIDQRSILNGVRIPPANTARYLGMTIPSSIARHTSRKNKGNCKSNSEKCTGSSDADPNCQHTKLLLYKQVLRPVWTHGVQL
jgi:hypothetical protein